MQASRMTALAAALLVSVVLLWLPPVPPAEPDGGATSVRTPIVTAKLADTWPRARVVGTPARLGDGTTYTPEFFLDADTSLGTAASPDGTAARLLLRGPAGEPAELRRVPAGHTPRFLGFTRDGDDVYWAESTFVDSVPATSLWRADLGDEVTPVRLTPDAGRIAFANSQYDLVAADGYLYWIAAAPSGSPATEVRSVPVTGGEVTVRRFDGVYRLSAWPWLAGGRGMALLPELLNLRSGARVRVPHGFSDLVTCGPAWCRAIIVAEDGGMSAFDMMRPDGADRHRLSRTAVDAVSVDVALLDRFEVLLYRPDPTTIQPPQLLIYDLRSRVFTLVGDDVGVVRARGGVLWWTGRGKRTAEWSVLDLRSL